MKIRFGLTLAALVTSSLATAYAFPAGFQSSSRDSEQSDFQVTEKTDVPGQTLKPGSYTITVLDHLEDRMVVRIKGAGDEKPVLFLALPNAGIANGAANGPVNWTKDPIGKSALRGFVFPGGDGVEFVYPKDDAVALAKANHAHVFAVDPKSQGMVKLPKLPLQDMQMVALWILSPTAVGPNDSQVGIAAERYKAPVRTSAPEATTVAQEQPAPAVSAPQRHSRSEALASAYTDNAPAPRQMASVRPPRPLRPAVSALPHTASDSPLLLLVALISLGGAATLSLKRAA